MTILGQAIAGLPVFICNGIYRSCIILLLHAYFVATMLKDFSAGMVVSYTVPTYNIVGMYMYDWSDHNSVPAVGSRHRTANIGTA